MESQLYNLLLAASIYVLGIITPGPSNLAIAQIAAQSGRAAGSRFASGVITGSFFWAILVASGLATVLETHANVLYGVKLAGGLYFLYFGGMLLRNAFYKKSTISNTIQAPPNRLFFAGLLIHLLNPKALAVWSAVIAISLPEGASGIQSYYPLIICLPLAVVILQGYAVVFSKQAMVQKYLHHKKTIDTVVGLVFVSIASKVVYSTLPVLIAKLSL